MNDTPTVENFDQDILNQLILMNDRISIQNSMLERVIVILWLLFIVISIYCGYTLGERMVSRK